MERGIRRTYTWFYLPDDVFFEPVLKAYEGPDKFFLHNVNCNRSEDQLQTCFDRDARRGSSSRQAVAPREMVEPDGVEPTTSCLQSRRSTN